MLNLIYKLNIYSMQGHITPIFKAFFHKLNLVRLLILSFVSCALLSLSACGISENDFIGTWMGLDEKGNDKVIYQIVVSDDNGALEIEVTNFYYEVNVNHSGAQWRQSSPHYFKARVDDKGNLVSELGLIKAKPNTFQLVYGDIYLTRKAKNTELKLKYVIREQIEQQYPGILIAD